MPDKFDALIVGDGHGGAQAAMALRGTGFASSIAIVGREREMPYERPPLSKEYLARERPFERLYLRPAQHWQDKQVALLLGRSVVAVYPAAHAVTCADGTRIGYFRLIWTADADLRAQPMPSAELPYVHAICDRNDADSI